MHLMYELEGNQRQKKPKTNGKKIKINKRMERGKKKEYQDDAVNEL